ncbi:MAG: succinylglutamate desuccinylase/aspartoacylase family protein [Phycisphaeraceae bacterium]|nr:succinylglutamate desuccinylase/aspartoacylase family protein [Phycisphaeraceae bacterium]
MSEITIGRVTVKPGQRQRLELPVGRLYTQTPMSLPIQVVNGREDGPRLWVSAAIHGDELNGVEIISRLLEKVSPKRLKGLLIAVPIVNVFGFIQQDRYLPDRRDLNRSFPGSSAGSLAGRLAHLFMEEVVSHCTHGIDLHTASNHRINLPQIRCNLKDPETRRIAEAFAAPLMMDSSGPRGSLRHAATQKKIPILVYEAGEPLRFNPEAIAVGFRGLMNVMHELGMLKARRKQWRSSMEVSRTIWIRARRGGILRLKAKLGRRVDKGQALGVIHDAYGQEKAEVTSPHSGLIIGHTNNPLVNQGDGIIHMTRELRARAT